MPVINIVKVIRATTSVFFVPCPVLLSFYLVLSYMFELNKWRCDLYLLLLQAYVVIH